MPGKFLGIVGQHPRDSKSNRSTDYKLTSSVLTSYISDYKVDILNFAAFIHLRYIL